MLEKETERLLAICQQRTIGRGTGISLREILAAEIPGPLRSFFRADVERLLTDELGRAREQTKFDYSHTEVLSLQRQMNSVLVLNYSFAREEYLHKLNDATHLLLNYLLRPQWTLSSFLFNTKPSLTASEIEGMFSYFGAYEYLKEVLLRYLQERQIASLTVGEFQRLVWRIDEEYMGRKDGLQIARLATPVYEFLAFPNFELIKPVPTKAIVKFFEDKRLRILCGFLEDQIRSGKTEVMMDELAILLEDARRTDAEAFQSDESFIKKTSSIETSTNDVPAKEDAASSPAPPQQKHIPPIESVEKNHSVMEQRQMSLADLRTMIAEDDRRRFLKKIFLKDEGHYESTMTSLNAMSSWKQASLFIDEIFIANEVDPYSNDARRFQEIVYQRFFPATQKQ